MENPESWFYITYSSNLQQRRLTPAQFFFLLYIFIAEHKGAKINGRNNALYRTTAPVRVTVYPVSRSAEAAKQKQNITNDDSEIFLLPGVVLRVASLTVKKIKKHRKIKFSVMAGK